MSTNPEYQDAAPRTGFSARHNAGFFASAFQIYNEK